jgi:hypothetical protein
MKLNLHFYKFVVLFLFFQLQVWPQVNSTNTSIVVSNQREKYPYWGLYSKTPISDIRAAKWLAKDNVQAGWDWSLPVFVKPATKANLVMARSASLSREKIEQLPKVNFPCNPVVAHWVNWRDLEPEEGKINFQPLIDNIKLAKEKGYNSIVRIHFSATTFAPDWIKKYNIPIRKEKSKNPPKVTNYDIRHPEFHKRYLNFVAALGQSGIPKMQEVSGLFLGYASPSFGDEGVGPYPEKNAVANDTVKHVIERIDAWANACKGVEYKVTMGGVSNYGLSKGFGIRRGFVEMYLYHIPSEDIGQNVDKNGYLYVDESNPIVANNVYNGDENEEYDEKWATESRNFRFGPTTVSYPYRYFTSSLRLLQMRCNDLLVNDFSLLPEMLPWVGVEMGKNVKDAADTWCFLRESYIKENNIGAVKNFERWLYQRDMPGFETKPAIKIEQAIKMWMVQPEHYYDFIAREGKKIGFDIDDNWTGRKQSLAIKVSYFDNYKGELNILFKSGKKLQKKTVKLEGNQMLKTATFFLPSLQENGMINKFDFVLEAGKNTENIVVSFVRVIQTNELHKGEN